jgi:hypothetical protein
VASDSSFAIRTVEEKVLLVQQGMERAAPLAAGFLPQRPGFEPSSGHVGFVVDKVALGRFSPSTSVSPANLHSTNCSTIILIYHLGFVQ